MKRIQGLTVLLALLLLCGVWSDLALGQTWTFKLGNATSPDHAYNIGARKYAELVAQKTGGKVKIDIYPATQLGNERDLIEGLQLGTVDLVVTSTGPVGASFPKCSWSICRFSFVIGTMPTMSWMVPWERNSSTPLR